MAGETPFKLPRHAQEGLLKFSKSTQDLMRQHYNIRSVMETIDKAYQRETNKTYEGQKSKQQYRAGDSTKKVDIDVPVIMPQVETAVAYQSSVFLSGNPLFGVVAAPEYMDAAIQMETIIDNQAVKGGWTRQLQLFFRDGFKYNLSAIEVDWAREVVPVFEADLNSPAGVKVKEVSWEGNTLRRIDPYNLIFDTRVLPTEVPEKGEFAGYNEIKSRVALKDFINRLPSNSTMNVKEALESSYDNSSYYVPTINEDALISGDNTKIGTNWASWFSGNSDERPSIKYNDVYSVKTLYARIIPSDFKIITPSVNTPQVWKLIIINEQVLIYAERQTNAHGLIPIFFGVPHEDGLGYQTKSLAMNVEPVQNLSSSLMASVIASRRRAVSDRTLYDPTKIREADINSDNPSAKIPVRASAYGKPLSEAVFPFPFRDDQSGVILQQIPFINRFAETITGQNQATQGQFVKGNKTLHEYSDVMARANGRSQTTSILYEAQVFTPVKHILALNILQYQGGTTMLNREQGITVAVDPVSLRKAVLEFKVSDGLVPSEKLINGEAFGLALQYLTATPQIASEYSLGALVSYLMKTQGANIKEFEKAPEVKQYEQAVAAWQQAVLQALKQNPELQQNQLPPQPMPEQFGIGKDGVPQSVKQSKPAPTIFEQVMAVETKEGEQNDAQ